ncbi:hypothetical protein LAC1533_0292 [Ligilactobacillus acidipiscis]|uniref:Uncharacterized protein n=1 Tax=Ligilactobacillus acidipiscis TaxID=89059 RepID=A0A1K1KLD6_9LACO|nr:hypothetical protein LAC1533_0292 [Ligilactobacillus acidipiscis]
MWHLLELELRQAFLIASYVSYYTGFGEKYLVKQFFNDSKIGLL